MRFAWISLVAVDERGAYYFIAVDDTSDWWIIVVGCVVWWEQGMRKETGDWSVAGGWFFSPSFFFLTNRINVRMILTRNVSDSWECLWRTLQRSKRRNGSVAGFNRRWFVGELIVGRFCVENVHVMRNQGNKMQSSTLRSRHLGRVNSFKWTVDLVLFFFLIIITFISMRSSWYAP